MEKKTTKNENVIKVDNKAIVAVAKGVAGELQKKKKKLKDERKSLKQTILFLCRAETEEGKEFREFFGLSPKSNKKQIDEAIQYIKQNFVAYAYAEKWSWGANGWEFKSCRVPCNKNGKVTTDYIDVILEIIKYQKFTLPKRLEIGRQIKNLWQKCQEEDRVKFANALKNTFAPKLRQYPASKRFITCVYI